MAEPPDSWEQGVYYAATIGSETTAAATGKVGVVRRDPMAMLPFCGYHVGDYFAHWLEMAGRTSKLPAIFIVNWFRKNESGKFAWPGYGQNMRVLEWMFQRVQGKTSGTHTSLGTMPRFEDLDWQGLDFTPEQYRKASELNSAQWDRELASHDEFFQSVGDRLPQAFRDIRRKMRPVAESGVNSSSDARA
jgi:phosphoenolpyruvate carboxykinase (GTP)